MRKKIPSARSASNEHPEGWQRSPPRPVWDGRRSRGLSFQAGREWEYVNARLLMDRRKDEQTTADAAGRTAKYPFVVETKGP